MNQDIYKNYFIDFVSLIHDKADQLKSELKNDIDVNDFKKGQMFAFYEVIDLLKSQAESFQLDFEKTGLNKINPDDYLF